MKALESKVFIMSLKQAFSNFSLAVMASLGEENNACALSMHT